MIRKLLATTALAALLTSTAMAQSTSVGTGSELSIFDQNAEAGTMDSTDGYFEASATQILASTLLGKTIYSGMGDDAEAIGDVNDVVMSSNGMALAVVVGVGGFLGMGEKEVAIEFSRLNWVERDNDRRLMMSATASELEAAPAFDRATIEGTDVGMSMDAETDMTMLPENDTAMTDGMSDGMSEPTGPRDGMIIVDHSTLSAEALIGTRVYGSDDADLGEIGDVILSVDGDLEAYIVDVGGFLGIGEKPVALDAAELEIMQDTNGHLSIFTPYTEAQLSNQPGYTPQAYQDNPDVVVIR